MAQQTFTLTGYSDRGVISDGTTVSWEDIDIAVDAGLRDGSGAVTYTDIQFFTGFFGDTLDINMSGGELSSQWERQGSITIAVEGHSLTAAANNRDPNEPYSLTLSSQQQATAAALARAITQTSSVTITVDDGLQQRDHAVDAGDASWDFAVPQPTVTHRTMKHAVDAGDASWDFAVPRPTVTHRTTKHAVDAGDASWDFAVPQPTVTNTLPSPVDTVQYAFRLEGESLDETTDLPTSTTDGAPDGWSFTAPARTETQGVLRIASTRRTFRGEFVSRTAWQWSPEFDSQPYLKSLNDLSRYIRKFVTTVRHKATGVLGQVVWTIQADPPPGADGRVGASAMSTIFSATLGTGVADNNSELQVLASGTALDHIDPDNAATIDEIRVGISTGSAEFTLRRKGFYPQVEVGDVVSVYENRDDNWSDYEITSVSAVDEDTRTFALGVRHIEHGSAPDVQGACKVGYSRAERGGDGRYSAREIDVWFVRANTPATGASVPATPTADSYAYATDTLANLTAGWRRTRKFNLADGETQFCSTVTVRDDGTGVDSSIVFSAPTDCSDVIDIDVIYRRAAASPGRPGNTAFNVVATGWYARPGLVPASDNPLWECVRKLRVSGANLRWEHDDPYRAEGEQGRQGNPGATPPNERRVYRNSDRGVAPATPTGGTYTKSTRVLVPPTGWAVLPSVPSAAQETFFSAVLIDPDASTTDEIALSGWSAPAPAGGTGPPGANGKSWRFRGNWTTATVYDNVGTHQDVVFRNGSAYACLATHTSSAGTAPPGSNWELVAQKGRDATFFRTPAPEVLVAATGAPFINEATDFSPNPATTTLVLDTGGATTDVVVSAVPTRTGLTAAITSPATGFSISTVTTEITGSVRRIYLSIVTHTASGATATVKWTIESAGSTPDPAPVPSNVRHSSGTTRWDASTGATGYLVLYEYRRLSDDVWIRESLERTTSTSFAPELDPGRYRVSVAAQKTGQNDSAYSGSVSFTVGGTPGKIGGVVAMVLGASGGDDVCLEWRADADADEYEVEWFNTGTGTNGTFRIAGTSYTFSNLSDGNYEYRVRGLNEGLAGPWSDVASVTVDTSGRPSLGGQITISAGNSANDAVLTWDAIPTAVRYRIRHRRGSSITTLHNGSATSFTVSDLRAGEHYFSVQGIASDGSTGDYGPETLFVVAGLSSVVPTVVVDGSDITVSYADTADEYIVEVVHRPTGQNEARTITMATKLVYTDIDAGTYDVYVTPRRILDGNAREDGTRSQAVEARVGSVLATVSNLRWNSDTTPRNNGTLRFTHVSGSTGYYVRRTGPEAGDVEERPNTIVGQGGTPLATQAFRFTNLSAGTHTFEVATNNGDLSSAFVSVDATISTGNLSRPSSPSGVSRTLVGGALKTDWNDAPSSEEVSGWGTRGWLANRRGTSLSGGTLPAVEVRNRNVSDVTTRFFVPQDMRGYSEIEAINAAGRSSKVSGFVTNSVPATVQSPPGALLYHSIRLSIGGGVVFMRGGVYRNAVGGRATGVKILVYVDDTNLELERDFAFGSPNAQSPALTLPTGNLTSTFTTSFIRVRAVAELTNSMGAGATSSIPVTFI